ncbi:hypothetical protein, partial [Streptomyces sp. MBT59]|uniref:hypothetical protein n=1 Tax=Streptomyces sp. MBT59 TaxID=1488390 RepID=UPI001F45158F
MAHDAAGDGWVGGRGGVLGAQQVGELGLQGVLIGGERTVPTGGNRQIGARRVQSEREPAEPGGQGLGRGPGVRSGVQENSCSRVVGQGLKVDQVGVRPPGLPGGVPAGDEQDSASVRPQPPPISGRTEAESCSSP